MPIKLNSPEQNAETQIFRQKSPINQYAVVFRITTNKIRILLLQIKLNSLEQTVETQEIFRQNSPISQYAVLCQIITNQTLL